MGQYYTPVVADPAKGTTVRYDIAEECSLKLTQHSFFGSPAVRGVSALLGTPKRVFWVGDYAGCDAWLGKSKFKDRRADIPLCPWTRDAPPRAPLGPLLLKARTAGPEKRFLTNHTRKEHIDLAEYRRKAESLADPEDAMHPLPILTACGNGLGGGDYWGACMDKVGLWAGDLLETADAPPPGSRPLEAFFQYDHETAVKALGG